jgi:hypothetical protein
MSIRIRQTDEMPGSPCGPVVNADPPFYIDPLSIRELRRWRLEGAGTACLPWTIEHYIILV